MLHFKNKTKLLTTLLSSDSLHRKITEKFFKAFRDSTFCELRRRRCSENNHNSFAEKTRLQILYHVYGTEMV